MRVRVALDDLEPALGATARAAADAARARRRTRTPPACGWSGHASVASSLDLRGARVEEALEALGRYLDDAAWPASAQVTIIHGMGTGALRDAVRDAAGAHPLVTSVAAG